MPTACRHQAQTVVDELLQMQPVAGSKMGRSPGDAYALLTVLLAIDLNAVQCYTHCTANMHVCHGWCVLDCQTHTPALSLCRIVMLSAHHG